MRNTWGQMKAIPHIVAMAPEIASTVTEQQ
jgi:hypothetical protein